MTESAPAAAGRRRRGLSIRLRLTLSYALFLMAAWVSFVVVAFFLLRFVPDANLVIAGSGSFAPNRGDLLTEAWPIVVVGTVVLALVGCGGGWLLAGRMLRPLDDIAAAVRTAAAGSLAHRVDVPGPDDELRSLADSLNVMLAKLERSFDEQRRFTRNASHELRTPLTITKTVLDVARADPDHVDVDVLVARLGEVNARAVDTIEALLRLAQADDADTSDGVWDLAELVRHEVATTAPNPESGARVEHRLAPAPVRGDRVLLQRLVANLLTNAVRHNLDVGGSVCIETSAGEAGPVLHVENTGAIVTAADVATFVEPFRRGAGRVGSGGAGLGLSIVDSIARRHGATLRLEARPGGGLVVQVVFPR